MKYYEGFNVNQDVYLIKRATYSNTEPSVVKGKIIYRGTKKIKISVEGFDIELKENKMVGSTIIGIIYTLYKTEKEANFALENEKLKKDLKNFINNSLDNLSIDQLQNIYSYILSC